MTTLEHVEYLLPTFWAGYLFNDDPSGMTDGEIRDCDDWCKTYGVTAPVNIEEHGFARYHDASAYVLACDCSTYSFLIPVEVTNG
jgi:hypothetical protein